MTIHSRKDLQLGAIIFVLVLWSRRFGGGKSWQINQTVWLRGNWLLEQQHSERFIWSNNHCQFSLHLPIFFLWNLGPILPFWDPSSFELAVISSYLICPWFYFRREETGKVEPSICLFSLGNNTSSLNEFSALKCLKVLDSGDAGKTQKNYCVWERVNFWEAKTSLLLPQTLSIFFRMSGCGLHKKTQHSHSCTGSSFFCTIFVSLCRRSHCWAEDFLLPI